MESDETLYSRQKTLGIKVPETVTVIGVGGVGSWVALDFALLGTKKLIIVDPDIIEISNLNRTMFKYTQVGDLKVQALAELILERRPDINIIPIPEYIENITPEQKKLIRNSVIVDCRDNTKRLPFKNSNLITAGYDGKDFTIFVNFNPDTFFTDEVRYTITPSYVAVPQLISALIVNYIISDNFLEGEAIINFNIDKVIPLLKEAVENGTVN